MLGCGSGMRDLECDSVLDYGPNTAYENAVAGPRPRFPIAAPARPMIPDRITWLNAEMIKTHLGTCDCARHRAAGLGRFAWSGTRSPPPAGRG